MSEPQTLNVLLLVGENDGADFVARALVHPQVALHPANEETMANALAHGPYDLAVVGGYVGSRGPLILCEAVRVQQKIPILILVGHETSDKVLAAHQARNLESVKYLDFHAWRDPTGSVTKVGTQVRTWALDILGLDEDPSYGGQWQQSLKLAQEQRDAALKQQQEAEAAAKAAAEQKEAEEQEADPGLPELSPESEPRSEIAPPFRTKLMDEDLDFMDRMIERTKNVDFRAKLTKSQASDHADAATQKLRDRIRELERDRARLAFVYRSRRMDFEAYDDAVQRLEEAERNLHEVRAQSEQQVQQVRDETARFVQETQQSFNQSLAQNQQMVAQLQNSAAIAQQQLQEQLQARYQEYQALQADHAAQLASRDAELAAAREQLQRQGEQLDQMVQQAQRSALEREQLVAAQAEREHATAEASAAQERELQAERDALLKTISDTEARAGTLNAALEAARGEIARLQSTEAEGRNIQGQQQAQIQQLQEQLTQFAQQHQQELAAAEEQKRQQLEQAQLAFAQEREQLQQRILSGQQTLSQEIERFQSAAAAERQQLEASFAAERQQHQTQLHEAHHSAQQEAAQIAAKMAALQAEHKNELLAAEEKLREQGERLQSALLGERQQLQEQIRGLEENHRQQVESLQAAAARQQAGLTEQLAAQKREHEKALAAVEDQWAEKTEQLKRAAGTFSEAYKDRDSAAEEQQAKISTLEQRLADKEQEITRLAQASQKAVGDEALERLARRFERGLENVRSQITKQEALLVTAGISGVDNERPSATTEGQAVARPAAPPVPLGILGWLSASPERAALAGAIVASLLVATFLSIVFAVVAPEVPAAAPLITTSDPKHETAREAPIEPNPDIEPKKAKVREEPKQPEQMEAAEPPELAVPEVEIPLPEPAADESESIPDATADLMPGSPEYEQARKELRREMFAAYNKKRWAESVTLGIQLREQFRLDWEAELRLAQAIERSGQLDEAVVAYQAFVENNQDNVHADEACLNAGVILAKQGKTEQARSLLEKAADMGDKKTAKAARRLLADL